jgi:hypothetical protein
LFLEDDFEVFKVFHGLDVLVDQVYVGLRAADWELKDGDGCEYSQHSKIEGEKAVDEHCDGDVEGQLE